MHLRGMSGSGREEEARRMTWKVGRQLILLGLVVTQTAFLLALAARVEKAETCNVVMKRYLEWNYGIKVNLDRLYEDGKKWVRNPRYTEEHHH